MDVIEIEKTGEQFRLVYDTKGRFVVHRISPEEASYKLAKVNRQQQGKGGVPYIATHDGRTIRYPDPDIRVCFVCTAICGAGNLDLCDDLPGRLWQVHTGAAVILEAVLELLQCRTRFDFVCYVQYICILFLYVPMNMAGDFALVKGL